MALLIVGGVGGAGYYYTAVLGNALPLIGKPFGDPAGIDPASADGGLASLVFGGLPQGATILVDGQIRQDTSIVLSPGNHQVVFQSVGFKNDSQIVSVRQGQLLVVTFAGKPAPQPQVAPSVTGRIEIAPTEIILRVGETQSLLATVYDDSGNVARSRLTYVSGDVRVASVTWNENLPNIAFVTGVSTGTVEIEVRSENHRGLAIVVVQDKEPSSP